MKRTKLKKALCIILASLMMISASACQQNSTEETSTAQTTQTETSEIKTDEVKTTETSTEAAEDDDLSAMKEEPMYNQTIQYWYDGGNCTSAPYIAEKLGYFDEYGIKVECLSGTAVKEALGTNAAQMGVNHIASLLIPITNDVDYTFVAGAHIGCKSLYVLADSEYQTTEDLKGTRISTPNGVGNSDYNITAMLLDADGINPLNDVELTPVETSACVAAMESGEISAALLSDTYAYQLVKDGKLRMIRSLIDEDFQDTPCCVLAMNNTFLAENPIMAEKMVECVKKASEWMRNNPEEAVQILLDDGKMSGDFDMNVELWNTLNFGLTDDFTQKGLEETTNTYLRLGLITSTDSLDDVMEAAWHPLYPEA